MRDIHLTASWAGAVALALAFAAARFLAAQSSPQAVTLLDKSPAESALPSTVNASIARNYREFQSVNLGESSDPELFTLTFNRATKLTALSASNDFHISGATCTEGHFYAAGDRCSVWVVFTPQGPGHRTGRLTVTHTASAVPFTFSLGGSGFGPVVSFIPALISTLSGTYPGKTGLLLNPNALAIDGGNNLYIADTGNNLIRYRDSSGVLSVLAGGGKNVAATYIGPATSVFLRSPMAVAIDFFDTVYIADSLNSVVRELAIDNLIMPAVGGGAGSTRTCNLKIPCDPTSVSIQSPQGLAVDPAGTLFLNTMTSSAAYMFQDNVWGVTPGLSNAYYFNPAGVSSNPALAVDSKDNLYYSFSRAATNLLPAQCYILGENSTYLQGGAGGRSWVLAGTRNCGFSGDGGPAAGAEISSSTGGIAVDAAGDIYFADTGNNRIRRVDAGTGIIHTIGGNGATGYSGDNGPATSAPINTPIGLAVDSMGIVYTTDLVPASSLNHAVVRQIGPMGALTFPATQVSTASNAQTVTVSNTGNAPLTLTSVSIVLDGIAYGATSGPFVVDPRTTTCGFVAPVTTLQPGRSCLIGVIYTPHSTNDTSASLVITDNSVSGQNTVLLSGMPTELNRALLSPATLTFPATAVGKASAPQTTNVSNQGVSPLSISDYSFLGSDTRDFALTHTCPPTLAAGKSCALNVTFTPTAPGTRSTTLSVVTSAGAGSLALVGNKTSSVTP